MVGARWTALAVVAVLLLGGGVVGCGGSSGDDGTDVEKIVLVVPGRDNDPDWTLQASQAAEEFPRDIGVRVDSVDASQTDDLRGVFEQVADEGNQLIVAHDSRYADTAAEVAADTGVPTLVWGERPDDDDAPVAGITVEDKESGYVAGITAVSSAYRRSVGIVVADDGTDWDLETWNRMAGGYVAGARSVDPRATTRYEAVGADGEATEAEAYKATRKLIAERVQMILGLGGSASLGVLRAIEDYKAEGETLFFGAVHDRSTTRVIEEGANPYILGVMEWNLRPTYKQAIRDVRAGTFGDDPYPLTLANRGITVYHTGRMPSDALEAAHEAADKLSAGEIDVPDTPTAEDVEQLIREGGS